MAPVLKIKCNDQVHRLILPEGEPTYEKVQEAISQVYADGVVDAKYLDDEGDLCTLSPGSFSDFLGLSDGKTLKLEVSVVSPPAASSAVSSDAIVVAAPSNVAMSEFAPEAPQGNPTANVSGGFLQGSAGKGNHFSAAVNAAKPFLEMLAGKAASFRARHDGKGCRKGGRGPTLEKIYFMLAQLRRNDALNPKSAAALILHSLPQLVENIAECSEKLDVILQQRMQELRPVIKDLQSLTANTPGLEECESVLKGLMSEEAAVDSKMVSTLLKALEALPFEARATFLKAFFASQEARLEDFLIQADKNMPCAPLSPLEHAGITCDSCERCPVKGLRFKCKSRPDYDLCAECFVDKAAVNGDECSGNDFSMMFWPTSSVWQWMGGVGKGMGKGMWNGMGSCEFKANADAKGKSKGKCGKTKGGKRRCHKAGSEAKDEMPRRCAREGCCYAATWHPTHCCARCVQSADGTHHGSRCERKPAPDIALEATCEEADGTLQHGPRYDLTFPVEVEDGRRLTISWNREDVPEHVAETFAQAHNIPLPEVATIVAFVRHANVATTTASGQGKSVPEAPHKETSKVGHSVDVECAAPAANVAEARSSDWRSEASRIFKLADKGQKGKLDMADLVDVRDGEEHAEAMMSKADTDKDGCLSEDEWSAFFTEIAIKSQRNALKLLRLYERQINQRRSCHAQSPDAAPPRALDTPSMAATDAGAATAVASPADPSEAERDLYSNARTLEQMGFGSAEELLEVLRSNQGNMQNAIDALLDGR